MGIRLEFPFFIFIFATRKFKNKVYGKFKYLVCNCRGCDCL